ncbi:ABC transporter ATP-binding protein [Beijerinckia indica]|uniref:ABC transporter related n=1 Tax=Beijerinckia indica subsp. indica (strain ATCC 9039 / DSM 1715 / NCIMB 8712) TaxID=395963 RepID=B2IFN5_BEII9|nr:ABC transporter ATP-binding protein [Beijerinckia indica]ACB94246.1 ABC transporter related [Beijerinckia indica subsp. indica ATCC 9039]
MSSDQVISCDHVGKAFQLYLRRNDQIMQTLFGHWKQYYHEHWVLKDISFKVARGESFGIIGRNGAGKTTLLQILCGITTPTHGTATVQGRIAPILALGTGFDHELTGRENALIGSAILGMKRAEALARMDTIAAFADIGEFFNQPLKMYSSGMVARLAFAVCAHADADILIVDEALSVGDAAFGAKCDAFIRNFAKHGTILFVSHDLITVEALCDRVLWIDDGRVRGLGKPHEVVPHYRATLEGQSTPSVRPAEPTYLSA